MIKFPYKYSSIFLLYVKFQYSNKNSFLSRKGGEEEIFIEHFEIRCYNNQDMHTEGRFRTV